MLRRRSSRRLLTHKRPSQRVNYVAEATIPQNSGNTIYVYGATSAGTITSIEMDIASSGTSGNADLTYAIVYVPDGYNANAITDYSGSTTFYEPEETVLAAGIASTQDFFKVRTKMSRRMREGDRIAVVLRNNDNAQACNAHFVWQASYLQ